MRTESSRSSRRSEAIGGAIRRQRRALGLTLEQLGKKIGTDKGTMSRIERGAAGLSTERLLALAKALGVDPADLLVGAR